MERRLTAILAADVVGYSRLMEADEAGTLAALKSHCYSRELKLSPGAHSSFYAAYKRPLRPLGRSIKQVAHSGSARAAFGASTETAPPT